MFSFYNIIHFTLYHNATTYKPNFMDYCVLMIIVRHDNRLPIDKGYYFKTTLISLSIL